MQFCSQNDEDRKIHPIQFGSSTINATERTFFMCVSKALAEVFDLRMLRVYLLPSEPLLLVADLQELQNTFKKTYMLD